MKRSAPINKNLLNGFLGLLLILLGLLGMQFYRGYSIQEKLQQAETAYQAGEKADNLNNRQQGFNDALQTYLELEQDYAPTYGTGKFYYNLGNIYFQLGQYPLAILNYEKALNLLEDPSKAQANLEVARKKANVETKAPSSSFPYLLFFHNWTLATRLQLLAFCISCIFAILSISLWHYVPGLKTLLTLLGLVAAILLGSALYSRFFSPIDAIVIQPTYLYRDAGTQYAKVKDQPLIGGSKVEVLGFYGQGNWMKISTEANEVGYINEKDSRLIDVYK